MFQSLARVSFCLFSGVLLETSSCLVTTIPGDSDGSSVTRDNIRVRFVNQSNWALDVQFYATAETGDAETVLFLDGNRVTADIGFSGTGLIPQADTDEIERLCTNGRMIGTRGGEFRDADTGESVGTGEQRVLVLDQQYTCEETITIIYTASGDSFETSVLVD